MEITLSDFNLFCSLQDFYNHVSYRNGCTVQYQAFATSALPGK